MLSATHRHLQVVYVDNGLSIMGLALDSKTLERPAA
jgi:hypothetical protein